MLDLGLAGRKSPSPGRHPHTFPRPAWISEPVEGQRPSDSDADSAGGFAPLAEQPRLPQSPHLDRAQLVNRRSRSGHRRTFRGHHSLYHRGQVALRDVEGSGNDRTE